MKKSLTPLSILLLIYFFIPAIVFAQYPIPKKEQCEQLKGRTLLVEVKDDTDTSATGVMGVLGSSFKEFWTITPVEFLTTEAFNQALATGDKKYAALLAYDDESTRSVKHYYHARKEVSPGNAISSGPKYERDPIGKPAGATTFHFSHYNLSISLLNGTATPIQVCTISFANDDITTGDLQFTVQQMARLIHASLNDIKGPAYYDHKKNIELVKTKTLLIPREIFKEKDLLKLKDSYEFTFKEVSLDEMNSLVLSRDDQYIYPKIIWSTQHKAYGWITVNPKEGNITSFMAFGGIHTNTNQKADEVIKVKDLKYIYSGMAQGINNKYK